MEQPIHWAVAPLNRVENKQKIQIKAVENGMHELHYNLSKLQYLHSALSLT